MVFRFGTFELDTVLGVLRHDGLRVRLSDKPFRLLNLLVECPGQIVNHEQIRQRLWGSDTFVDFEGNLSVILAKLRQVLGDSPGNPLFIETVPRRGYRFVAPVTSIETASDVQPLVGNAGVEGLQEPQPVMVVERGSGLFRSRRAFVLAALLILGTATLGIAYFWWLRHSVDATHASHNVIILVTPFENLSGDPSQEYLSDGLTEEMITQLGESAPEQLSVIARSTALRYKGSHKTVEEIGNEQNVDYILEGSLRRQGNIVRVTAQLFKVRRKGSLWAKAYERDGTDILSVQRDVANRIADSLSVELLPSVRKRSAGSIAVSPEAHDDYLKGLFEFNKRTEDGLRRSIQYFRQGIERDPNFGAGYAALAYSYATAASWTFLSPEDAYPNARQAAQKALSIDGTIAEAHFATAEILHEYDWDWSGAEKEYQRALQLNPSSATGHKLYAEYLTHAGRYSDALAELRRAQHLDPLSMITNSLVCYVYVHARQYNDAISECKKALELDPNFGPAHYFLGEAYSGRHLYDKALLEHRTARDLSGDVSMMVAAVASNYAASGNKREARKLLGELLQRSKRNYVSAYALAKVYASLGDHEQARQALERAFEQRSFELLYLADDPLLDPVRNELWFKQMVVKRGFPNSAINGASAAPQPPAMH
jgi:TolB-like protein/DNA-binding winged helix-turn-helix (wHTH) protein/tetratricopeptide (TPR) repeat protein